METFEEILTAGGHTNSLGRLNEVLNQVRSKPSKMSELFACIDSEDAWVRMRAIDAFEKLVKNDPKLAKPYTEALINELTEKDQPSIQWHLAQLYAEIELDQLQRAKAIHWLKSRVSTTGVDWIVSVNVMKTLLHFYVQGCIDRAELKALFEIQVQHDSKTVRKKAQQFLEALK